jgi:hypothetical protein
MAVAVEANFPGATLGQYDEAIKEMGLTPGGQHPGALFHWVTKTDSGVRVTDVWERKDDFERFAQESVLPVSKQVGLPEPEIRYIDVHTYMVGG